MIKKAIALVKIWRGKWEYFFWAYLLYITLKELQLIFWLDNLKSALVFFLSLAPVHSLESWSIFLFANSGIMPLFLPRLLTWNFKKFLAAKKIIAALILGSESNIFRRCSWHFTSASTFSLSSGNPITSVSSLQQMKSSVILVKSCADYNVFSFPSQVGLF